jgi:hypothetical protein
MIPSSALSKDSRAARGAALHMLLLALSDVSQRQGCGEADEGSWMPNQAIARLRRYIGKDREGHDVHAPFHVTTHRGHTVQTFQSLELALEAAQSLGPDHYVIDRHGLQIWSPQRKLLRNEE